MKKLSTLMLFLSSFFAVSLFAWMGNSYLVVNGTWYTGSNNYVQPAGKFHDANLGSFANSFTLNGEVQVYPNSSTAATLYYRIDNDNNNIKTLSLPKIDNEGNNSKHSASTPATIDVSGLSAGVHYIDCWFNHGSDYDNNGGSNFKASFTVVKAPVVTLSVPDFVYIDETIILNATPENVDNPVITYSVKAPGSGTYVITTSPYEPTATGTYTFKAEVKEDGVGDALASDTKDVIVKTVPDPIVINAKVPASWENDIHLFVFNTNQDGWKKMTQDGDWYTYTFTRLESVNIIFVNGDDWGGDANQTVNVENVTSSTCYQVNDEVGKKTVTAIPCVEPSITLTALASVYVDETITLSATANNVDDPVITYSVKVPESSEFVVTTSPYEPAAIGTYTFKAEVKEGGVGDVLASDTKDVIVKEVPDDIVIKVHKSVDWENLYIFVWNTADDGHKLMSQDPSGWYVHTFTREEEVNFLFVNVDDFGAPGKVQTNNVENVTESNCYEVYEEGENVNVTPTDCNKIITAVSEITDQAGVQIRTDNQTVSVDLEAAASISLYAVSGQLLSQHRASTHFVHSVKSGVYILQIDGKSHKLIVK
ncbi:MAG: T9SS type A sorting domain-containing protein [Pigmentiphaga sp.]|nr:T9SS type A sorting domain-containing protein [Pigmentiphaga sp.]